VSIPLGPHPDGALATFSGEIALDDSVYVLDVCRESGACERSIVDLATLATTTSDVSDRPLCSIVGVIDDLVVGYRDASCTGGTFDPDTPPVLAVQPLDGGEERIFDDVPLSGGGQLVQTAHGPVLVATTMPGDDISHQVLAVSLIDGSVTTLLERGADARSFMTPLPVRLPPGYVLIGTSLADEPAQRNFLVRDVPILVDLDSGEQTPLPNLPHSIDPAP